MRDANLLESFVEPLDRCRSHWGQIQAVAVHRGTDARAQLRKQYPDSLDGHRKFVHERCEDFYFKAFQTRFALNTSQGSFDWIERNVAFWGMSDMYEASLCVLYYYVVPAWARALRAVQL